jgi:predicted nucleic acid-binding protein
VSLLHVTIDTGFLIGLEKNKRVAHALLLGAVSRHLRLTLPAAALAEWWRGSARHKQVLKAFRVEPMSERLAKAAGEALAVVSGATVVDAIVMASAAIRGDAVYTSDPGDLSRLHAHFRAVRGIYGV